MRIDSSNTNMFNKTNFEFNSQKDSKELDKTKQGQNLFDSNAFSLDFDQSQMVSSQKVLQTSENDLSSIDKSLKQLVEKMLERFSKSDILVYPKGDTQNSPTKEVNPYASYESYDVKSTLTSGKMISSDSAVYYQKQTLDFNAKIQIQTPNQTFEMEISVSISQEILMASKGEGAQLKIDEDMFKDPFMLQNDEDKNPFEGLDKLNLEFDLDNDGENDILKLLKDGLNLFASNKNKDEDKIDDLQKANEEIKNENLQNILKVWQKDTYSEKSNLIALVDLNESKALYFSSFEASYSRQSISYSSLDKNNSTFELSV